MKKRSDIFHALEHAIEVILTCSGTERERALQAMCEVQHLESGDFTDHFESMYFEQIHAFEKELRAKKYF